jgi:hypothetical protein
LPILFPSIPPAYPETFMSQPEPNVDEVVKSIAEETGAPTETVSRLYADTLANYQHDARVFDYVRNQLRHHSNRKH